MKIRIDRKNAGKTTKLFTVTSFIIWFLCVVAFFACVIIYNVAFKSEATYPPLLSAILLTSLLTGVATFILGFIGLGIKKLIQINFFNKKTTHSFLTQLPLFGVVALGIIILILLNHIPHFVLGTQKTNFPPPVTFMHPTSTPTPTPTVTQARPVIIPTVDPDPIVKCSISANCGGGTLDLRRSVCSQSTCCQIGDKWYFYQSTSKCDSDQNAYYYSQYRYVPPAYTYPTYTIQVPTYEPLPTIPAYNYQPSNSELYQQCVDSIKSQYNSTMSILRANGASDSSAAEQAEYAYRNGLQDCATRYGQ